MTDADTLPPPCPHSWSVLQMTVQEGQFVDASSYSNVNKRHPDTTCVLLACSECGDVRQEQMTGKPVRL